LLYSCCIGVVQESNPNKICGLIPTLHRYNNCTTPPHMGVDYTYWASPPCEEELCNCYGGVVNPSFSIRYIGEIYVW